MKKRLKIKQLECLVRCFAVFFLAIIPGCQTLFAEPTNNSDSLKPRLIVLTDVSTWETDDHESLTRLMVHADLFEIEGIIFTTGYSHDNTANFPSHFEIIHNVIDAYELDLPNLLKRSGQIGHDHDSSQQKIGYWPSADYLRELTMWGSTRRGMQYIGEGNNSDGSNFIIELADEEDDRPLWITIWGGGNTLAQAIWQVQQTRSDSAFKAFLHKIPTYAITDQDRHYDGSEGYEVSCHQWLRREFADDLFFIWDECAWKFQNGTGVSNWTQYETHIQGHGNLGSQYPEYKFGVEGDTPAFLHLLPNGVNNPNEPRQCGWGGYSEWSIGPDNITKAYNNYSGTAYNICRKYEDHFYTATFNNFAARMDWAQDGAGNINPIVSINGSTGIEILTITPKPDSIVRLDASASFDPDDDDLIYNWWLQPEAGTYSGTIEISNSDSSIASVVVPPNAAGSSFHIICEIRDNGTHPLTSYRRIIFKPSMTGTDTVINQLPVAYAGPNQIQADTDMDGVETVMLYGSGSNDFDGSILSYVWSKGSAVIAHGAIASVELPLGEHRITLTVTDDKGDIGTDETVVSITDLSTLEADIWLEAECGEVGSLWNITADNSASHNEYVTVIPGNNSTDNAPTDDAGFLTYTFEIQKSGIYTFYFRVVCPSANDDSFWIKVDEDSFEMWNNIVSSTVWTWTNFPTSHDLISGSHTLTIGYREDGAKLDKIYLTNTSNLPSGEGLESSNCDGSNNIIAGLKNGDISIFPNPTTGILTISVHTTPCNITLYNNLGNVVYSYLSYEEFVAIDLRQYPKGIYRVRVVDANTNDYYYKVLKI